MCNKISYADKAATVKEIKLIKGQSRAGNRDNNDKHKKMKPYKCHFCLYWHITTTSKNHKWRKTAHQRKVRHEGKMSDVDAELKELFNQSPHP